MKPEDLKRLIAGQRQWTQPLTPEEQAQGFKSWYSSKYLPHFDVPGAQQYLTYRLADSLPAQRHGEWDAFMAIEDDLEKQRKLERYLDLGHGACHLRDPRIAELVQANLWYHDGVHYRLLAWVVMPNHIHALIEVWQVPLRTILQKWKSYTAKAANQLLGCRGTFWEDDYFDRYIRNEDHLRRCALHRKQPGESALGAVCGGLALEQCLLSKQTGSIRKDPHSSDSQSPASQPL